MTKPSIDIQDVLESVKQENARLLETNAYNYALYKSQLKENQKLQAENVELKKQLEEHMLKEQDTEQ